MATFTTNSWRHCAQHLANVADTSAIEIAPAHLRSTGMLDSPNGETWTDSRAPRRRRNVRCNKTRHIQAVPYRENATVGIRYTGESTNEFV